MKKATKKKRKDLAKKVEIFLVSAKQEKGE